GGLAVEKYGFQLENEQEALARLADLAILIYAAESALLRTRKRLAAAAGAGAGGAAAGAAGAHTAGADAAKGAQNTVEMTRVYVFEAFDEAERIARTQLAALAEGDELRTLLSVLRKLTRRQGADTTALK